MSKKTTIFLAIFIGLFYFIANFFILSDYGVNWDEPVHFIRGQAYLHYFLTGKKDYNDLSEFKSYYQKPDTVLFNPVGSSKTQISRRSMYQNKNYTAKDWLSQYDDFGHPPLSGILASFFNYVFFQRLGMINDVDSYHMYITFVVSVLIGVVFFWTSREYSLISGLTAILSLSLYPLFFGESHFNVKDVPEAVFYSLTLLSFYESVKNKNIKWMLFSAVLCGIALASKYNIAFASIIMFLWFILYVFGKNVKSFFRLIPSIIIYPIIAFSILVVSWPLLWPSPINNFLKSISYYQSIGTGGGFDSRYLTTFGINTYPIQWILYTTPPIILFFSAIGIFYALRFGFKEKNKTSLLILFWFLIPILRVSAPDASIYGGVRQIMEYIPSMAILSGIGAYCLSTFIRKNFNIKLAILFSCLAVLSFLPLVLKLISIHPNESTYFNSLIGGLKGAKDRNIPYWGESLGNPLKQGLAWVDKNAEKNSKLVLTFGLGSNLPSILIRPDIEFHNMYRGIDTRFGEYAIGLTNKSPYETTYYVRYLEKFLNPAFEAKVDNVSLVKVWVNDRAHTKPSFVNEHLYSGAVDTSTSETVTYIKLGQITMLRKLSLDVPEVGCKKNDDTIIAQTSINGKDWVDSDNDLGRRYLQSASEFSGRKFNHLFAAEKAKFIRLNFITEDSCLAKATNLKLYIF